MMAKVHASCGLCCFIAQIAFSLTPFSHRLSACYSLKALSTCKCGIGMRKIWHLSTPPGVFPRCSFEVTFDTFRLLCALESCKTRSRQFEKTFFSQHGFERRFDGTIEEESNLKMSKVTSNGMERRLGVWKDIRFSAFRCTLVCGKSLIFFWPGLHSIACRRLRCLLRCLLRGTGRECSKVVQPQLNNALCESLVAASLLSSPRRRLGEEEQQAAASSN